MANNNIKTLSIDPGTKHMGFASFEGMELLEFGVKTIKQGSVENILDHIGEIIGRLIDEKKTDYLALEKNSFSQSKHNLRLAIVVSHIRKVARRKGVLVYEYDPRTIRKEICNDGNASKKRVAQTLIVYYPELKIYLNSDKNSVLQYYYKMFDAVAVGVTFIRLQISPTVPIRKWLFGREK